jgi:hypothetical protein
VTGQQEGIKVPYERLIDSYGESHRVIANGKSATGADDIEVQRRADGGEWITIRTFNSISDDYAYLNAREWAQRCAVNAVR